MSWSDSDEPRETVISRCCALSVACVALALGPPPAARAQSLEAQVRACAAETDVLRRLECYDRAAAELVGARTATPAAAPEPIPGPVAPPPVVPPVPTAPDNPRQSASAQAAFGTRNGPLDPQKHAERLREIAATVSRIQMRRADGVLIVSLDNDQVWVQNEPVEYFPLKVGDNVRIRSAALGSYLMLTPAKRTCRVTRIH